MEILAKVTGSLMGGAIALLIGLLYVGPPSMLFERKRKEWFSFLFISIGTIIFGIVVIVVVGIVASLGPK